MKKDFLSELSKSLSVESKKLLNKGHYEAAMAVEAVALAIIKAENAMHTPKQASGAESR